MFHNDSFDVMALTIKVYPIWFLFLSVLGLVTGRDDTMAAQKNATAMEVMSIALGLSQKRKTHLPEETGSLA